MVTQISPESMPTTWSDVMARPTCAPTFVTPGIVRSSAVARETTRLISGRDVPGAPSHWISRDRSRNAGASDPPSWGATRAPTATTPTVTTTAPAKTGRARSIVRERSDA